MTARRYCAFGCGRAAVVFDGGLRACRPCAERLAAGLAPVIDLGYVFPPAPDNTAPSPDPAFDAFAAEYEAEVSGP